MANLQTLVEEYKVLEDQQEDFIGKRAMYWPEAIPESLSLNEVGEHLMNALQLQFDAIEVAIGRSAEDNTDQAFYLINTYSESGRKALIAAIRELAL